MKNDVLKKNIKRNWIITQILLLLGAIFLILGITLYEENLWFPIGAFICIITSFLFGLKAMRLKKKLRNDVK